MVFLLRYLIVRLPTATLSNENTKCNLHTKRQAKHLGVKRHTLSLAAALGGLVGRLPGPGTPPGGGGGGGGGGPPTVPIPGMGGGGGGGGGGPGMMRL